MRNIQWRWALVFLVGMCGHNTPYAADKTAFLSNKNAIHRTKQPQKKNKKKLITKLAILAGSVCAVGCLWMWLKESANSRREVVSEQNNDGKIVTKIEHKAACKSKEVSKDAVKEDAQSHYVFTLTELGAEVQKETDLPVDCISIIGDYLQWDECTQQSLPSIKYVQLGVRDGKPIVLIQDYGGRLAVLDGCTGTSLCDFQGYSFEKFLTSLSPNGEQFCAYKEKIFYALDTKTGQEQRRFEERKSLLEKVQGLVSSDELYTELAHMIFSPKTGEKIVTYMAYKTIVWDAETNKNVYESSPNMPWRSPKTYFDDDGIKLLLNCGGGALDVVDLKSLQPTRIEVLKNNVDILTGAVLTSSGDKVVASVDVRRLDDAHYHYVFDSTTGVLLASIAQHGIGPILKALSIA